MKCGFCGRPATEKGSFMGGAEQYGCEAHAHLLTERVQVGQKQLTESHLRTLACAFLELNTIRARDGAPDGVAEDYFSSIVDGLDEIMIHLTGKTAHCHPALYLPYVPVIGAKHERSNLDDTSFYTAEDFPVESAGQDRIRRD